MEEIWKDIVIEKNGEVYDYTGLYQVSNMGRVRSLNYRRSRQIKLLKQNKSKDGYLSVMLYKNKKPNRLNVHRLVATAFCYNDDPINKAQVNHIDENPSNNIAENLEWCDSKYNMNYGNRSKNASASMKGKPKSEEHKRKISESHKGLSGEKHPRYGKPHNDETKQKIGKANSKKIICVETKQVFESIKEANEWLKKGYIQDCLRGRAKSAGRHPITGEKLHWMYLDDYLKESN